MKGILGVALLLVSLQIATAIVCVPALCDGVKQEPLTCKGKVIKGGGFCGCSDICAKQEGESCGHMDLTTSLGECDEGLTCVSHQDMMFGLGKCKPVTTKREAPLSCQTARRHKLMMMVVYKGEWIPKCEADGSYSPQQCDNTGSCFCVDTTTGEVDASTKVSGPANC